MRTVKIVSPLRVRNGLLYATSASGVTYEHKADPLHHIANHYKNLLSRSKDNLGRGTLALDPHYWTKVPELPSVAPKSFDNIVDRQLGRDQLELHTS
tara:strand:+ start:662 stop:952 length:291 start_codon:yes stop_codon:yes gene_type:complete